ncbi:hypothetical protein Heshes_07210 [Alicyclobacillus hesperidum]|uniref:Uncharacterized protein n=1 Tax=Alicyclobacillus hesperidum TaxID=89784 RepID=A0A1H2WWK4_9BACL|nr:hypothetical protein [Alicyclobacillus hesperidum]GLV13037.1 hypothetical protein Heshes_07210 [Alicyclobacillus hesperidum]SDW84951.1 hypothetical protein SAMN04489725_11715 [Alicyclobacillus hesperidum]
MEKWLQSSVAVPRYARICGLIALSIAILCAVTPTFGVLRLEPAAVVLGAIALFGGFRGVGAGILVMCAMDLILSPAFWTNVTWATSPYSVVDHSLAYFDVVGIIAMSALLFKRQDRR